MMPILYVALGGALGSVARFWISRLMESMPASAFPWATLVVNITGSFLIGILFVAIIERAMLAADLRYLLMIGLLGGFTTYSAFSLETILMLDRGQLLFASGYVLATVMGCLVAVWSGIRLTRLFFPV